MALYIPHSIFHLARLLYVRPERFGPYYVHIYRLISDETHKANTFNNCGIVINNINVILHITKLIILITNKNIHMSPSLCQSHIT
jgi:hypothetical protein